jgi:hypothetical protein
VAVWAVHWYTGFLGYPSWKFCWTWFWKHYSLSKVSSDRTRRVRCRIIISEVSTMASLRNTQCLDNIHEQTTIYVCCTQIINWGVWLTLQVTHCTRKLCHATTVDESCSAR